MARIEASSPRLSRDEVIAHLRSQFVALTGDDDCMCRVADKLGIFCRGFKAWSDQELQGRYYWLARRNPDMTRSELEELANTWQLSQQERTGIPLCCDVQEGMRDTCRGWSGFTNDDLGRFYFEVTGQRILVV